MRIVAQTASAALACLIAADCVAVGGSLNVSGQPINNTWLIQPGDRYSGTAYLASSSGSCSGTLIAPTVILTAAHCNQAASTAYFIDNSANNWDGGFTGISVSGLVSHPSWTGSVGEGKVDLALVFLSASAPSTARISSFYSDSLSKAYSGSILLGGFGNTRNQATGLVQATPRDQMNGTIDGVAYSGSMPYLNAAANYLRSPSGSSAALITAKTDLDYWFPNRRNASADDPLFNYYRQKSPYGYQEHLINNQFQFTYGGYIPLPSMNEGTTLSGDSGSSVFLNRRALIESYLWHIAYDEMMAVVGIPDDSVLRGLKSLYQDDTNYLIGVTSYTWIPPELAKTCPTEQAAWISCFSNHSLAGQGGGGYTMLQPYLDWISDTMEDFGAGDILISSLTALDGVAGTFEHPDSVATLMLPPTDDLKLVRLGLVSEPTILLLLAAGLFGAGLSTRRRGSSR